MELTVHRKREAGGGIWIAKGWRLYPRVTLLSTMSALRTGCALFNLWTHLRCVYTKHLPGAQLWHAQSEEELGETKDSLSSHTGHGPWEKNCPGETRGVLQSAHQRWDFSLKLLSICTILGKKNTVLYDQQCIFQGISFFSLITCSWRRSS